MKTRPCMSGATVACMIAINGPSISGTPTPTTRIAPMAIAKTVAGVSPSASSPPGGIKSPPSGV